MAFRRKDDHRYRASDSDTRLTRFRPKYKTAHDKGSERELPEICRYCVRAHKLFDSETMLCERKGVVSCRYTCRRFVYDPLKHVPFQAPAVFDEDMVMPTLDDLPDDIAADAAQPAQTSDTTQTSDAAQVSDAAQISDTAQTASTASSDSTDSNAEPATASSDAAESARGSGIDAESSDGASAADGQTADEKSADRQTSDGTDSAGSSSAAQGGESDSAAEGGNAVKSESEESAYPDKKTAAGASDNGGEKSYGNEVRSQFGMESLWSDTSR